MAWRDEKFKPLSTEGKLFFLYAMTGPHSNMVGMYYLGKGSIQDDIPTFTKNTVDAVLKETELMISYDPDASVLLFRNYLRYNPVNNSQQVQGAVNQVSALPRTRLADTLIDLLNQPDFAIGKNRELIPILETKRGSPPANPANDGLLPVKRPLAETPAQLVELWNQICGGKLPRVKDLTRERVVKIKSRLQERPIAEWKIVFEKILTSPFLMGEGGKDWRADFDFVIRSQSQAVKILEGSYGVDRPQSRGARGLDAIEELRKREAEKATRDE